MEGMGRCCQPLSCFPWAAGGYPEHLGWGLSSANNPARLKNSLLQLGLELGREPWMKMLSAWPGRRGPSLRKHPQTRAGQWQEQTPAHRWAAFKQTPGFPRSESIWGLFGFEAVGALLGHCFDTIDLPHIQSSLEQDENDPLTN